MSNGKVVRNAGSHRILYALSIGNCTSKDLKNVVGAINSVARFEGEYMKRLLDNGYVKSAGSFWKLTELGQQKLDELGPAGEKRMTPSTATPRTLPERAREPYVATRGTPMRPGSEEFLSMPSRIGNTLYYRDGRKETVNE